ncbi:crossover junction endodeoxyribonuclease RuvC [Gammaproteobacteria bacterium]|nr:crossover junction endodeoxyribonuclease RuvC [Gammaproteobacteria bacterium]
MAVILGIDPGSRICGYGLINSVGNSLEFIACGCIKIGTRPFPERLQIIHAGLTEIIAKYSPQQAAIESVFVGKSANSALKLGQARGAAIVACTNQALEISEYAPRQVKRAVVGTGTADKGQMQHMVTSILSLSAQPQEDAADALCIAVCHAHTQASLIRRAGPRSRRVSV